MSDYSSTKTSRTLRSTATYNPTSAVGWWFKIGTSNAAHRRANSDTVSIISSQISTKGKTRNRSSIPVPVSRRSSHPSSPARTPSRSLDSFADLPQSRISFPDSHTDSPVDETAVSDTSLEELNQAPLLNSTPMAERNMRQPDRPHVVNTEDRRERPRPTRTSDTAATSSSTLPSEPSLFEACRELQRRNVKVSLPSILSLAASTNTLSLNNSNSGSNNGNGNGSARQHISLTERDRDRDRLNIPTLSSLPTLPTYPEHLLNLPPSPDYKDICLRTILNAGASVDFIPHNTNPNSSPSHETFVCEDCKKTFSSEAEWDTHLSKEKTFCPVCDGKFDCHGLLLKHACYGR